MLDAYLGLIQCDSLKEHPLKHTLAYVLELNRRYIHCILCILNIVSCHFGSPYCTNFFIPHKNGDAVVEKSHHVTSNAECARRYGSHKNSKMVSGRVIASLNKPTDKGRKSWYFQARYNLGGGTMKIAELNVRSIKAAPVVPQSVPDLFHPKMSPTLSLSGMYRK